MRIPLPSCKLVRTVLVYIPANALLTRARVEASVASVELLDQFRALVDDLQMKFQLTSTRSPSECSRREFISAVLYRLIRPFKGVVTVSVEHPSSGNLGRGKIDYALLYKEIEILVTECKKDVVDDAVPQNVAQMQAAQQVFMILFVFVCLCVCVLLSLSDLSFQIDGMCECVY